MHGDTGYQSLQNLFIWNRVANDAQFLSESVQRGAWSRDAGAGKLVVCGYYLGY